MTILLTAFEPFGGCERNISLDTMTTLPDRIGEVAVHKVILPVSFKRAPRELRSRINEVKPDFIIMLGQCVSGDNIRLERYAHNMMDSVKADNDGFIPDEEAIYNAAPEAYRCPLPLKKVWQSCIKQNLPVVISNTAGLYVCNRVYFEALHSGAKGVFIHIPHGFEIDAAAKAIRNIIDAITQGQ